MYIGNKKIIIFGNSILLLIKLINIVILLHLLLIPIIRSRFHKEILKLVRIVCYLRRIHKLILGIIYY
jgi:hypothetical protein